MTVYVRGQFLIVYTRVLSVIFEAFVKTGYAHRLAERRQEYTIRGKVLPVLVNKLQQ
ncbi:hypothetical protein D3C77_818770 [compost metagenome]